MAYAVKQRSERLQQRAWADQYAAAPPAFAEATGLRVIPLGDGLVQFLLPAVPFRMFNRVLGAGIFAPLTEALLDTALVNFAQAGATCFAITLTDDPTPGILEAHGLTALDRWAVLHRTTEPVPDTETALRIVAPDPETFGAVLCQGYELPDAIAAWGAGLVGRPGWRTYIAYQGTEPVGCAAMFVDEKAAWFGPAATLPAQRGRGSQTALLARRIADARAMGCTLLVTEALPDTPQTPNPSYRNMVRAGFTDTYRHVNYGIAP